MTKLEFEPTCFWPLRVNKSIWSELLERVREWTFESLPCPEAESLGLVSYRSVCISRPSKVECERGF